MVINISVQCNGRLLSDIILSVDPRLLPSLGNPFKRHVVALLCIYSICNSILLLPCVMVCVCVFSSHSFWTPSSLDVPAGVTQGEGHTGLCSTTWFLVCFYCFSGVVPAWRLM